ncbi:MAG TPA: LysM peptidoglycan-binding domain-containing protein, partial [Thermoanaerobaculia bacterium]|nr:LysM peptidoglycan-binding domain-containing protein [Thermoanaerobaculia bacterium]
KLTIGAAEDRYEQEADRMADRVTGGNPVQRSAEGVQSVGSDAQGAVPAGPGLESRLEARRGQGNPLPDPVRGEMEHAFGADFGGVRLHSDGEAAEMSHGIQARAFTYGNDIYLGQGGLDRRLLAHELTHTIQQGAAPRTIQRSCHTVAKSETLYSIAKHYSVTVKSICDANGIKETDPLALGKFLVIPDGKACAYNVQDGDTLFKISQLFNTTADEIKKANGLKNDTIKKGQVLTIPVGGTASFIDYTVKKGDTLYSIATAHGVSVADIQSANGKTDTVINPGDVLKIPSSTGGGTAPAPAKGTPKAPAAKPPAASPAAKAPAPAAAPATGTPLEAGHEAGRDYSSGTLRERKNLRQSDKSKFKKSGRQSMFFEAGATVTLKSSDGKWVEVEGEAFVDLKKPVSVGTETGWIERSATTMSLGDFQGPKIEDLTGTYGKLSAGDLDESDVNNVILHQTGGTSGAGTLSSYGGRIKSGSTVGAHYLIDESGNTKLVVPVNQKVSHVGATKAGFATASNSHAVGIEHVGAAAELDVPKDSKDTTTLTAIRTEIKAMDLTPELKARVLGLNDRELTQLAKDNRPTPSSKKWLIYGDINAKQKRSSFLLTEELKTHFGLAAADLLAHETVASKTIGEGENIKEFLTARVAYPGLVTQLESAINGDPKLKANADLVKILNAEKSAVDALSKDATAAENTALAAEKTAKKPGVASAREDVRVKFYDKFWDRHTQLKELVDFLKASGSSKAADLAKKVAAWKF